MVIAVLVVHDFVDDSIECLGLYDACDEATYDFVRPLYDDGTNLEEIISPKDSDTGEEPPDLIIETDEA